MQLINWCAREWSKLTMTRQGAERANNTHSCLELLKLDEQRHHEVVG